MRDVHRECRACTDDRLDGYPTAVLANNSPAHRKTEPRPFTDLLGREERFEDPLLCRRGHTVPIISNFYRDPRSLFARNVDRRLDRGNAPRELDAGPG